MVFSLLEYPHDHSCQPQHRSTCSTARTIRRGHRSTTLTLENVRAIQHLHSQKWGRFDSVLPLEWFASINGGNAHGDATVYRGP